MIHVICKIHHISRNSTRLTQLIGSSFAPVRAYTRHPFFFFRQATIGPTAVNSIMSFNYAGGSPYKAVTLAFFSGIIEILCGILNLGFLIQYISQPVVTAFSSAVCIQVK